MSDRAPPETTCWHLYVLRCDQSRLYTGISTNPQRRLRQHRGQAAGARCLRGCHDLELAWSIALGSRSLALRAEHRFKRLSPAAKRQLVAQQPDACSFLTKLGLAACRE